MSTELFAEQCAGKGDDGGSCPFLVVLIAGTIPLCAGHRDAVDKALDRAAAFEPPRGVHAVVYYLGDPERQLVKIGTSTDLRERLRSIRKESPRALLLATEPGTYARERSRHRQFQSLHVTGEWFRKVPILMEHVNEVRSRHGLIMVGPRPVPKGWIVVPRQR